jgi:hypothetical protein
MRVEHAYAHGGAWAYLAALGEPATGIAPFERLVDEVMRQPPYNSARRVFWVMDNGSSHRGKASVHRLTQAHPRLVPVHEPLHANWLNPIEIYFSIVRRKLLTPNDFPCLKAVAERLANFERYYESIARPFEWKFPHGSQRTHHADAQSMLSGSAPEARGLRIRVRTSETACETKPAHLARGDDRIDAAKSALAGSSETAESGTA